MAPILGYWDIRGVNFNFSFCRANNRGLLNRETDFPRV